MTCWLVWAVSHGADRGPVPGVWWFLVPTFCFMYQRLKFIFLTCLPQMIRTVWDSPAGPSDGFVPRVSTVCVLLSLFTNIFWAERPETARRFSVQHRCGLRIKAGDVTVAGTEVYFKLFLFSSPSHLWSLFVFVSLPGAAEGARSLHVSSGLQAWTLLNCCYLVQEFPAISPSFPDLDSDWSQTKGSSLRMSEVKRLLPLKQV